MKNTTKSRPSGAEIKSLSRRIAATINRAPEPARSDAMRLLGVIPNTIELPGLLTIDIKPGALSARARKEFARIMYSGEFEGIMRENGMEESAIDLYRESLRRRAELESAL